jgi:hypothetical protein
MQTDTHCNISRSVPLTVINVSDKSCRENQNTRFVFENFAFYELLRKNTVEPGWRRMKIWRMRIAYWIIKATDTYSEYVILIAFPLQHWWYERASLLRYTCIVCFVSWYVDFLTRLTD